MPLVEKLEPILWEVRRQVADGIARVLFTVDGQLLHEESSERDGNRPTRQSAGCGAVSR